MRTLVRVVVVSRIVVVVVLVVVVGLVVVVSLDDCLVAIQKLIKPH